jgi:hypothetical protein
MSVFDLVTPPQLTSGDCCRGVAPVYSLLSGQSIQGHSHACLAVCLSPS